MEACAMTDRTLFSDTRTAGGVLRPFIDQGIHESDSLVASPAEDDEEDEDDDLDEDDEDEDDEDGDDDEDLDDDEDFDEDDEEDEEEEDED
jgi:hypothetical protein